METVGDPVFGGVEERHPTYATVGICHHSGARHLFGSDLDLHHGVVALQIYRASRVTSPDGDMNIRQVQKVVEVVMSAAQWAAVVGTPNMGTGVPCTIQHIAQSESHRYADPPRVRTETAHEAEAVRKAGERVERAAEEAIQSITRRLEGKVSKKLLDEVANDLKRLQMEVKHNSPWYVERLREAADKTVAAAQTEIDAFITGAATRLGFDSMKQLAQAVTRRPKAIDIEGDV